MLGAPRRTSEGPDPPPLDTTARHISGSCSEGLVLAVLLSEEEDRSDD
jgi:hypothetical protein